jgi:hypothetical protein
LKEALDEFIVILRHRQLSVSNLECPVVAVFLPLIKIALVMLSHNTTKYM